MKEDRNIFNKRIMNIIKKGISSRACKILFFYLLSTPTLPNAVYGEDPQYQGLSPRKGREQILENCTACHSTAIILQNHMPRKQWDQTLTWMQEKQGLWHLEPSLRKVILDYLSTTQGIKNSPSQSHNPLGHQYSYRPNPL